MKRDIGRSSGRFLTLSAAAAMLAAPLAGAGPASAGPRTATATPAQVVAALGGGTAVTGVERRGDADAVGVAASPVAGFPTAGADYLVLSTGPARNVVPGDPDEFTSVNLAGAAAGADGNDLTQLTLRTRPPAGATCLAFDFAFLSEEFPEWVGSDYNDIFTAELNQSLFEVRNGQVVAPNNFAYDGKGGPVSVNTVFGMSRVPGTVLDGATPALTASSPVEKRSDGTMDVILSVQDLEDSILDSAVVVDNLRFGNGQNCAKGSAPIADADGDALPDAWEENGLDVDGNGTVDLDLPAMGATPDRKDLFVEFDHMVKSPTCVWLVCWGGRDFAPSASALADVREAFAAAPVPNPDGTTGIRAHFDAGAGSVMTGSTTWGTRSRASVLPWQQSLGTASAAGYDWSAFDVVKSTNFELARRDVFHYAVYADTYAGSDSSGISRGEPSSDLLVTDGASGWGGGFTRTQERGTLLHELGHGLGLKHGGDTDADPRAGYRSVMSYLYQLVGLPPDARADLSRGAPFVDWSHLRFDGGAIGARGAANLPGTTPDDEPGIADFNAAKTFGRDGDGRARLAGPSVLLKGSGTANLLVDVTNSGHVADTYTVTASSAQAAVGGSASVAVGPGATKRVSLPVPTAALAPATLTVSLALSSGGGGAGLTTVGGAVTVVDGADTAVRRAAELGLKQLKLLPPAGAPDPGLVTELERALGSLGGAPGPSLTPTPSGTPSVTPSVTPSATPSVTPSSTPSGTPSTTPSVTPTGAPPTPTPSSTPPPPGAPTCDGKRATIVADGSKVVRGTKGDDVIVGTAGDETIKGLGGNDTVCGLGGDDRLEGAAGHDRLEGGTGDDVLIGDDGRDTLFGGAGHDVLDGGDNDDVLRGEDGADLLRGGDGKDLLHGGADADVVRGGAGRDEAHGDTGADRVEGGDGDDRVFGEEEDDTLYGNDGNDALFGGPGLDHLSGGPGRNTLVQ